ncbi:MAG: hypothetical protein IJA20_02630 [Methanocorpusculum sp.]|nr:hypothetical protein [Methanocorpusculum sp.]
MKGFPKNLNTKHDYEYIRANFPVEQWAPEYQMLLDSRFMWLPTGVLESEAEGIVDATHKVEVEQESAEAPAKYIQYELLENEKAKIFRLGFSVEEVESILTSVPTVPTSDVAEETGYMPGL